MDVRKRAALEFDYHPKSKLLSDSTDRAELIRLGVCVVCRAANVIRQDAVFCRECGNFFNRVDGRACLGVIMEARRQR